MLLFATACSEYELEGPADEHGAADPDIEVSPSSVDFGTSTVECERTESVVVANVGETTLNVSAVFVDGDVEFSVAGDSAAIQRDESITLDVVFFADEDGRRSADLVLLSDDPDESEVRVPLDGGAGDSDEQVDVWEQSSPPVDVLWVVDNSSSMGQEQARVISEISSFFSWFVTLGLDFHMGVVTSDVVTPTMAGRLQGSPTFIEPDTTSAEAEFAEALNVGTDDQGDESGLHASELALTEPVLSVENAGFYRDDAQLVVVFLSDEPEQSAYDSTHYIDFFTALKADPGDVGVHAIVGDYGTGCASTCDGAEQTAEPGDKYVDVVGAFGGIFGSICECDLSPALDAIGLEATSYIRAFELSDIPLDPLAITVHVDGELTTDWSYDADRNALILGAPPTSGQVIQASYLVTASCVDE